MLERDIEKRVVHAAKARGWLAWKLTAPGTMGVPDRLLLRNGRGCLIEFKTASGRLTPLQRRVHEELAALNIPTHIVRSVEDGLALLEDLERE